MDSVRFGRILGKGTRAAARGLYQAVDAVTAPNPNQPSATLQKPAQATQQRVSSQTPVQSLAQAAGSYNAHKKAVTREARRAGRSFFAPFARAGHVLWLETMGCFFALFTVIFISYIFRYRAAIHFTAADADARRHLLISVGATLVFLYFTVSSFARARRRERR